MLSRTERIWELINKLKDWRADVWDDLTPEETVLINDVIKMVKKYERL